jgi:Flp pilus assembly protein TadG
MRKDSSRSSSRRGATLVEFALTTLLFLALTLGGFEVGRAIWTYATVSHATKQAVRYAMIHGADNAGVDASGNPLSQDDVDEMIEEVVKENAVGLNADSLTVVTTWTPSNVPGSTVGVRVRYPFQFLFNPLTSTGTSIGVETEYKMVVTN